MDLFSDLMTALMVLFLVVMSVALLAVTKTVSQEELQKQQRQQDIEKILDDVQQAAKQYPGVTVDRDNDIIDFGEKAQFDKDSYTLTSDQQKLLRAFVPRILAIANGPLGLKWVKQIVVEGFASPEGTYLYNLNLSLDRSQSVLCALFPPPFPNERRSDTAHLNRSEICSLSEAIRSIRPSTTPRPIHMIRAGVLSSGWSFLA